MTAPRAVRTRWAQASAHADWADARRREARAVIADVAHHSDHLIRLACDVLVRHGESAAERRDARALLFVVDGRRPLRQRHDRHDRNSYTHPDAEVIAYARRGYDEWWLALDWVRPWLVSPCK